MRAIFLLKFFILSLFPLLTLASNNLYAPSEMEINVVRFLLGHPPVSIKSTAQKWIETPISIREASKNKIILISGEVEEVMVRPDGVMVVSFYVAGEFRMVSAFVSPDSALKININKGSFASFVCYVGKEMVTMSLPNGCVTEKEYYSLEKKDAEEVNFIYSSLNAAKSYLLTDKQISFIRLAIIYNDLIMQDEKCKVEWENCILAIAKQGREAAHKRVSESGWGYLRLVNFIIKAGK